MERREKKTEELDYEFDIRIDESALDVEWLEQSSLMFKYARNAVKMRRELDLAKEKLDVARASANKRIREDPDKYDVGKVTEGSISAAILRDREYKQANTEYINAKYESDMANAAVKCIDSRKDALENLVRLHGQEYFAGPKVPRNIQEEREMRIKRHNASIGKTLRRDDD